MRIEGGQAFMKLSELIEGLDGPDVEITGITADSREVRDGFLFAALPGVVVDGTKFIDQALSQGAAAILTHENYEGSLPEGVPLLQQVDPRLGLAELSARFYAPQPDLIVGVTGTNGKTSVASFVRQIWEQIGIDGASLGTIGVVSKHGSKKLDHTTPDPVTLHKALKELTEQGVDHLALEASSHGLAQRRLDGLNFTAAAFTNITRDHLDYHETFEAYFNEKKRLFSELLGENGIAVIDADAPGAGRVIEVCEARHINVMTIGRKGRYLNLKNCEIDGFSQKLTLVHHRGTSEIDLPLVGDFQASNVLVAAALVAAGGVSILEILPVLETLKGPKGRLELAGSKDFIKETGKELSQRAPVFIDYAHTPDALETAIKALLPYKQGRLHVVFGCGGDRDKGKRPMMGEIASRLADCVYVTDDNPRGEDPSVIRSEIMAAAKGAQEIGDRALAIQTAVDGLSSGDILLVAGKGHETGQIVGSEILPFSDHEAVEAALENN